MNSFNIINEIPIGKLKNVIYDKTKKDKYRNYLDEFKNKKSQKKMENISIILTKASSLLKYYIYSKYFIFRKNIITRKSLFKWDYGYL